MILKFLPYPYWLILVCEYVDFCKFTFISCEWRKLSKSLCDKTCIRNHFLFIIFHKKFRVVPSLSTSAMKQRNQGHSWKTYGKSSGQTQLPCKPNSMDWGKTFSQQSNSVDAAFEGKTSFSTFGHILKGVFTVWHLQKDLLQARFLQYYFQRYLWLKYICFIVDLRTFGTTLLSLRQKDILWAWFLQH